MIDLYAGGSPNVVKIFLALEEMGLPYRAIPVDIFQGAQFKSDFLKLNPVAKIPVIVDHDGPGGKPITIFESGAILLYLADKTGQFLSKEPAARTKAIEWMMVQMTGIGPMFGQYVHFVRFAPKGNDYSLDRYRTQVYRFTEAVEGRLGEAPYLGGAEYSIADMATFPWLRLLKPLIGKDMTPDYPKVMAWVAKISERPAFTRTMAQVDQVRAQSTTFENANDQMRDKVFGRGEFAHA